MDLADVALPDDLDDGEGDPLKRALALLSRVDAQAGGVGEGAEEQAAEDPGEAANGGGTPTGKAAATPRPERDGNGSPGPAREETRRPRPARPIYTLQTIHERTGIPYATLALYAVSHRERIPFLGERHSPAYPREGLEEFCRIHEEKNPGWQRPAEGTEAGWDDEAGLGVRLGALAEDQARLADELRNLLAEVRKPWRGEAEWV